MNSDTCPRKDDLVAYALGKLGDDLIDTVSGHLESCPDCLATVQGVDDTQDSIFDILRRSTSRPVFHEEPECRAAIEAAQAAAKERDDGSPIDLADTSPLGRIRDYVLLKKIGEGGMGTVYAAMHSRLQRLVAIKTLTPGRSNNEQAVSRFLREMKAVGRLEHPNIVRAIDAGEADGTYFLAFEYIEGVDLSCLIRAAGPLSVADACEIVRQAADALQAVHDHGLVHRDVKPSNLMLTVDGAVKLLDLGLAVWHAEQMDDADITATGHVLGTLEYVAPEQAMDVHDVDIRADIYSLGCTLYALLVGHPPFQRSRYRSPIQILMAHGMAPVPPIQELRPELPATLLPVLNRMLAKQTDDRFGTPKEVNKALAEFARGTDLKTLFGSISCIGDKFDINQWPALCGELHRAGTPIPRAVDSPALAVPTNHRHHRVKTIAIAVVVAAIVVGLWHFRPELVRTSASHSHSGDIDDSDATNDSASLESRSNTDASRQFPSGAPWLPKIAVMPPSVPFDRVHRDPENPRQFTLPTNGRVAFTDELLPDSGGLSYWIRTESSDPVRIAVIPASDGFRPVLEAEWIALDGTTRGDADFSSGRSQHPVLTTQRRSTDVTHLIRVNVNTPSDKNVVPGVPDTYGRFILCAWYPTSPGDDDADVIGTESSTLLLDDATSTQLPKANDDLPPRIEHAGDVDVFQIVVGSVGHANVRIEPADGLRLVVRTHTPTGDLLGLHTPDPASGAIRFDVLTNDVYLSVSAYDGVSTGTYSSCLHPVPPP